MLEGDLEKTELDAEASDDTVANQEPNEVVTSDGGNTDEKPDESGQTQDDNNDLIPGQYRRGEAHRLARDYQYLLADYTRKTQELATLKEQAQSKPKDPQTEIAEFAEDVKKNPVDAIRKVARSALTPDTDTKQLRFELAYERAKENKEFVELEPAMVRIAQNMQDLITPETQHNPKILKILFDLAKAEKHQQDVRMAETRGAAKGERTAIKKTKLQFSGSASTKGETKQNFNELSLEEQRKTLIRELGPPAR